MLRILVLMLAGSAAALAAATSVAAPALLPAAETLWYKANPTGLTEADVAKCLPLLEAQVATYPANYPKITPFEAAASHPMFVYNWQRADVADERRAIPIEMAFLKAKDEERMLAVIGVVLRGKDLDKRLAHGAATLCLLDVRDAQLGWKRR